MTELRVASIRASKKYGFVAVFPVGWGMPSGMYFASSAEAQAFIESKGFAVGAPAAAPAPQSSKAVGSRCANYQAGAGCLGRVAVEVARYVPAEGPARMARVLACPRCGAGYGLAPELAAPAATAHDLHGGAAGSFAAEGCAECVMDQRSEQVADAERLELVAAAPAPRRRSSLSPECEVGRWHSRCAKAEDRSARCSCWCHR